MSGVPRGGSQQLGKQLFIPACSHEVLMGGGVVKNGPLVAPLLELRAAQQSPGLMLVAFTVLKEHMNSCESVDLRDFSTLALSYRFFTQYIVGLALLSLVLQMDRIVL